MEPKYKPGEPVLIFGTLTRGIAGKVVMVYKTLKPPYEHTYVVEYYKHVHDVTWERVEREFDEGMLLPYTEATKLLYLD